MTEYQQVALPESYLADCDRPELADGGVDYRAVAELAVRRGAAIDACNARLTEARRYQAEAMDEE